MQQIYHSNATTNIHIRSQIKNSREDYEQLALRFNTSVKTISKWKSRTILTDKSSKPNHIAYALTPLEKLVAISIRKSSWLPLDQIHDMLQVTNPSITRSAVYRTFVAEKINTTPQEKKEKAKTFKQYKPGYLHIDVTYLPKFNGESSYLFVAIDRATRVLYFDVYSHKTAENSVLFMNQCIAFFPATITHVLTDNGLEFTNSIIRSKKGNLCKTDSKLDVLCKENNIKHRLTKPACPQTNGMVERVNGTIKNSTILVKEYKNQSDMKIDLNDFMCHYNLYRTHGSLKKELKIKTPIQAVENWYQQHPELFKETPQDFKTKLLNLQHSNNQEKSTTL
jgi:transposase InsO family protein